MNAIAPSDISGTAADIRPAKLAHIVLRTNERFEQMAEWYRTTLNAQFVHKDEMLAFLTFDDEHHRVAIARVPDMTDRPSGTVGVDHVAFTYARLEDLLLTYERLKTNGVTPLLAINHGATTSIYYEDPDRNRVELQVDNFADFAQFEAFLKTGAMARNSIGVAFDPDEALDSLRAGTSAAELQRYREGPIEPEVIGRLMAN